MVENIKRVQKVSSESSIQSHLLSSMYHGATAVCDGALTVAIKELTRKKQKTAGGNLSAENLHLSISGQTSFSVNFKGAQVIADAANKGDACSKGIFISTM